MDVDVEKNLVNDVNVDENDRRNGGFVDEDDVLEIILSESQRVMSKRKQQKEYLLKRLIRTN